jgi:phosphate-selective porin OprO/OprP
MKRLLGILLCLSTASVSAQEFKLDQFTLGFSGLAQVDYSGYGSNSFDDRLVSGVEARRLRLAIKGKIQADWSYVLQYDFAGDKVALKDAYLGYKINDRWDVSIGHLLQDSGMESTVSARDLIFIERGLPYSAWFEDRNYGVSARFLTDSFRATFGLAANNEKEANTNDKSSAAIARFNYRIYSDNQVFHVGYAVRYKSYEETSGSLLSFKTRPASVHFADVNLLNTGALVGTKSALYNALELIYMNDKITVAGEYHQQRIETRGNGQDYDFNGYYVLATYSFAGATRPYDKGKGVPGKVKGSGYETGVRMDHLNLNSKSVRGGEETDYSAIFAWYPNDNIKFAVQATYSDIDYIRGGSVVNENPWSYALRTQFHF